MRLLLPLVLLLTCCRNAVEKDDAGTPVRVEATRPLMGTLFKIIIFTTDPTTARQEMDLAFNLAEDFAERATDYDPDSELNRLTRTSLGKPVKVSPDLFQVLLLGREIAQQTNGIFDPTYGPLTHLWRETARTKREPSPEEIAAARSRCGIEHLTFDEARQTITVDLENMQLDLGGIAKGYAADLIFDHLVNKGYQQCLVAAAGDIRVGEPPPEKEAWTISLRTFHLAPTDSIPLKNAAISTSGDLYQQVNTGGKTFSHLIDVRTGLGLTTRRAASVILPEAKLTDPFATVACLADDPMASLKNHPNASIQVVYEDSKIAPVLTGVFEK
jgi:thiamine biosynthesis lipoprotein